MFSKVLIKLVDEAILPAVVLLTVRICSVVVFAHIFNVSYSLSGSGFVFETSSDYILINSYSVLSMVLVLSVGVLYVLLKSYIFHDTHIRPSTTARLFSLRLTSLIQTSFDLYSQGTIWLSYLYLVTLVAGFMFFTGFIFSWVFVTSLVLALISTGLFIYDIEREAELNSSVIKEEYIDIEEDYILRFGGDDA